jgi:hypothetical protein
MNGRWGERGGCVMQRKVCDAESDQRWVGRALVPWRQRIDTVLLFECVCV